MVITINGTDYKVRFGIGFVRALDEKYYVKNNSGTKFGSGLETKIPMLLANDVVTLSEFIYLGTCTDEKRPTQKEVDEYVDSTEDIEKLFEEVAEELKKHNATKLRMRYFTKILEAQKEAAKKEAAKKEAAEKK